MKFGYSDPSDLPSSNNANAVSNGSSHFGILLSKSTRASTTTSLQYLNCASSPNERHLIRES